MLPKSSGRNVSSWLGWAVAGLLLVAALSMWFERQLIIDAVQYSQFTPSKQVGAISDRLELTESAKFTFYASHPTVEAKESFNEHCKRQEANSPILGCYGQGRIYIYDITDSRLKGIKEVTAAHELLHAVYERLSGSEKKRIDSLLQSAYERLANSELKERMAYYEENEPGEEGNELHSIIPTEFPEIGNELEEYYKQYFNNRQSVVKLHTKVNAQFTQLSQEANKLVAQINSIVSSINSDTNQYNSGVAELNQQIKEFNELADQPGGFASQGAFNAERARLQASQNQLEALRAQIETNKNTYTQLMAQLDSINTKTASLNESIDSVLSEEPEI